MTQDTTPPSRSGRRKFIKTSAITAASLAIGSNSLAAAENAKTPKAPATPEWRNSHPDMAYRMLGRTGFMVSEVVCGGSSMNPDNIHIYEAALQRGLNYLDMAMNYGKGRGEKAIAALLAKHNNREDFFLTTKLSPFNGFVYRVYGARFEELPSEKQNAVQKLADELMAQRGVLKPGYHADYFNSQSRQFGPEYRMAAMKQLGITAGSKDLFKRKVFELLEESLGNTNAGYYDVLFCQHSAASPEGFDNDGMFEALEAIKQQGKARSLAFSCHNDPARVLEAGAVCGHYDAAMIAYNIVNHAALDRIIQKATADGLGIIAMKAANPVVMRNANDPKPDWRIQKLNSIIPGDKYNIAQKGYLFNLQNPHLAAVISEIKDEDMLDQNLSVVGKKIELQKA